MLNVRLRLYFGGSQFQFRRRVDDNGVNDVGKFRIDDDSLVGTAQKPDGDSSQTKQLQSALKQRQSTDYINSVVDIVIQTARAIQFAHTKRILHCDIKPGNILIDREGNAHVIDFGLARNLDEDEAQNRTHESSAIIGVQAESVMAGTEAYMAPEQFQGNANFRTDVFGLGATLFHALTFAVPYPAKDGQNKWTRKFHWQSHRSIRHHSKKIPRDLDAIVCKSIHPVSAERYSSPEELAQDLERFQQNELVRARKFNVIIGGHKWALRNPVKTAGMVFLILISAVLASAFATEKQLRNVAEDRLDKIQNYEDAYRTTHAGDALQNGQIADVLDSLLAQEPQAGEPDQRNWEWHAVMNAITKANAVLKHSGSVTAIGLEASRKCFATGDSAGVLRVFETKRLQPLFASDPQNASITAVAVAQDGLLIVTGNSDGDVTLYDTEAKTSKALGSHILAVTAAAVIPEQDRFATAGADGVIHLYSIKNQNHIRTLVGHRGVVQQLRVANGQLISSGSDQRIIFWDLETGGIKRELSFDCRVDAFAVNRDATRIALEVKRGVIGWFDLQDGKELATFELDNHAGVASLEFNDEPPVLAVTSNTGIVHVLKVEKEITRWSDYRGHLGAVSAGRFLDAQTFASAGSDGTVRVWEVDHPNATNLRGHYVNVDAVEFSRDGKLVASAGVDMTIRVWNVAERKLIQKLGKHVAEYTDDGRLRSIATDAGHEKQVTGLAFHPDGTRLASAGFDNTVRLWNLADGRELQTISTSEPVMCVAWSKDGNQLISGGWDDSVQIWDAHTGQNLMAMPGHTSHITCLDVAPDGKWIATGSRQNSLTSLGEIRIWNANTGQLQTTLQDHDGDVACVRFHPDGQTLVSGGSDKTIRVWDFLKGELQRSVRGHLGSISSLDFSADGTRLASTSKSESDRFVRIWDTTLFLERLRFEGKNVVTFGSNGDLASVVGRNNIQIHSGVRQVRRDVITQPITETKKPPEDSDSQPRRALGYFRTETVPVLLGKEGEQLTAAADHQLLVVAFSVANGELVRPYNQEVPFEKLTGLALRQEIERRKDVFFRLEQFRVQVGNGVFPCRAIGEWPNEFGYFERSGSRHSTDPNRLEQRQGLAIVCEIPSDASGEIQIRTADDQSTAVPLIDLRPEPATE